MSSPPPSDRTTETPETGRQRAPRWVRLTLIALVAALALLAVVLLLAGGEHGPGRHAGPTLSVASR